MDAIKRLQDVYNLKPFDFTGGEYGIHTGLGSFLTAMDAYNFGRGAFMSEDMEYTQQWMAESLRLLDMEPDNQKEKPSPVYCVGSFSLVLLSGKLSLQFTVNSSING